MNMRYITRNPTIVEAFRFSTPTEGTMECPMWFLLMVLSGFVFQKDGLTCAMIGNKNELIQDRPPAYYGNPPRDDDHIQVLEGVWIARNAGRVTIFTDEEFKAQFRPEAIEARLAD